MAGQKINLSTKLPVKTAGLKSENKTEYIYNENHKYNFNFSDMILEADWKSDSPKYFFPAYKSATDYGACCLITPYLDFELSNDSKTISDGGYSYTGADYHAIPKGLTRNGIQNGLKIILDVENYDYAYFPRGAKGFRAVVGDSRDKAVINQNGFYIAAGN